MITKMITNLKIENFTRFSNINVEIPTAIVGIFGGNEAGKTSIRDAIKFALLGECRNVKLKKDMCDIIKEGEKKATVSVDIISGDEVLVLSRSQVKSGQSLTINEMTVKTAEKVYAALGTTPELLNFAFDSGSFLSKNSKERKEFLQQFNNIEPSADFFKNEIESLGVEIPEKLVNDVVGIAMTGDFNTIILSATENRRACKRKLEEAQKYVQVEEPRKTIELNGKSIDLEKFTKEQISEKITKNKNSRDEMIKLIGAAEARKEINTESLKQELSECESIAEKEKSIISKKEKSDADLKSIQAKKSDLEKKSKALSQEMSSMHYKLNQLESKPIENVCPVYNVPCKSVVEIQNILAVKKDEYDALKSYYEKKLKEQDSIHGEIKKIEINEMQAKTADSQADMQIREINQAKKKIAELKAKLNESENEENVDVSGLQKSKAIAEQNIANAESVLNAKKDYDSWKQMDASTKTEINNLNNAIFIWDKIEKAFQPDGIPQKLLDPIINLILEKLDDTKHLLGNVSVNSDLVFYKDNIRESLLSESAQFRLGLLIQDAICRIANVPFLIVDRVDVLEPKRRMEFINMIISLSEYYENIIFFSTADRLQVKPSPIPEMTFYYLEEGAIEKISAEVNELAGVE